MGKKLAIKGHPTRGKEVIELLEILGGTNPFSNGMVIGNKATNCYYISEDTATKYISWDYIGSEEIDKYEIFTLEEFFRKYPFKIGDKVTDLKTNKIAEVYKMHWSENTNCVYYDIKYPNNCGCQRRLMDLKSMDDNKDIHSISECKTIGQGTYAIRIADGYKFDSIDENGNIIVKSVKPKYPTNYDDCCDILNADEFVEHELMTNFPKLINARNAYWKIAGKEMGLDGPWKPDWNSSKPKYTIVVIENKLVVHHAISQNYILAFPTEEIRDAFYKNFAYLIEACKELL